MHASLEYGKVFAHAIPDCWIPSMVRPSVGQQLPSYAFLRIFTKEAGRNNSSCGSMPWLLKTCRHDCGEKWTVIREELVRESVEFGCFNFIEISRRSPQYHPETKRAISTRNGNCQHTMPTLLIRPPKGADKWSIRLKLYNKKGSSCLYATWQVIKNAGTKAKYAYAQFKEKARDWLPRWNAELVLSEHISYDEFGRKSSRTQVAVIPLQRLLLRCGNL